LREKASKLAMVGGLGLAFIQLVVNKNGMIKAVPSCTCLPAKSFFCNGVLSAAKNPITKNN
jgi:hypothetical protein